MKNLLLVVFASITLPIVSAPALSHPGRTAADGCHYCRTNCEKWGVTRGARHCHNGNHIEVLLDSPSYYRVSDLDRHKNYLNTKLQDKAASSASKGDQVYPTNKKNH